jgi:hypothetical protein
MSGDSLNDSITIARMANALRSFEFIESAFVRSVCYDQHDIDPCDIARFDRRALWTEQTRRRLFAVAGASVLAMAPMTSAHAATNIEVDALGLSMMFLAGLGVATVLACGFISVLLWLEWREDDTVERAKAALPPRRDPHHFGE